MNACKHSRDGLCKSCSEQKPYMQFKMCKDKCFKCKGCGYFWGPGNEQLNGQPVIFSGGIKKDEP